MRLPRDVRKCTDNSFELIVLCRHPVNRNKQKKNNPPKAVHVSECKTKEPKWKKDFTLRFIAWRISCTRETLSSIHQLLDYRQFIMNFIVALRGCPGTTELGSDVRVTSTTTFATIRQAIADKRSVAAAAVAVFVNSVEVTNYADEIGAGFARDGLVAYELRVSAARLPHGCADFVAAATAFMSCRKCVRRFDAMDRYRTLNCGCLLCAECAEQPVDCVLDDDRSMTVCPYHLAPTPHDVELPARDVSFADDASWTHAPYDGPHEELAKLLRSQQCQFPIGRCEGGVHEHRAALLPLRAAADVLVVPGRSHGAERR
jgi:hypothetical protein